MYRVRPLQLVCQRSGVAPVVPCSTRRHKVLGSILLAVKLFSYFLLFSFYCNMPLIQFNDHFNHHFHIFMLSYLNKCEVRKCEYSNLYISANNSSL